MTPGHHAPTAQTDGRTKTTRYVPRSPRTAMTARSAHVATTSQTRHDQGSRSASSPAPTTPRPQGRRGPHERHDPRVLHRTRMPLRAAVSNRARRQPHRHLAMPRTPSGSEHHRPQGDNPMTPAVVFKKLGTPGWRWRESRQTVEWADAY